MCINPIYIKKHRVLVPCGKCGNCLKRSISDYAIRLSEQFKHSNYAYFITLTYAHAPTSICREDLQKFFKRCRKAGHVFSYFALGDYGDTYGRPHYHVIWFSANSVTDDQLATIWRGGYDNERAGFIKCKPLSLGRIYYVVRYGFLAKVDWKEDDQREKPFFLISKRPAIGSCYFRTGLCVQVLDHLTGELVKQWEVKPRVRFWHHKFWYYPEGRFKKALPRYYKLKLYTKATRDLHTIEILANIDKMRERIHEEAVRKGTHFNKLYYERVTSSSDKFLGDLRARKARKNKLFTQI